MRKASEPIRHKIARIIVPNIYATAHKGDRLSGTPRPMILFLKDHFGSRPLVGAEVGVANGANAESMFKVLNIKRLILVDSYQPYIEGRKGRPTVHHNLREFVIARERLSIYREVIWIRKMSKAAAPFIEDGSLDFCYIDANHSYEFVREDLKAYWEKIKPGGFIGGHDCFGTFLGLIRAVLEFAEEKDLEIHSEEADYWFMKQ